jgi:hypothetical protein
MFKIVHHSNTFGIPFRIWLKILIFKEFNVSFLDVMIIFMTTRIRIGFNIRFTTRLNIVRKSIYLIIIKYFFLLVVHIFV